MNIHLIAGQFLTVTLPDGQSVEIDVRDPANVTVWHCNPAGDPVASLEIEPEPDAKNCRVTALWLKSKADFVSGQAVLCHFDKCHRRP